jgi:hypothetical protein
MSFVVKNYEIILFIMTGEAGVGMSADSGVNCVE